MGHKYDPKEFWDSINKIKAIKETIDSFPPSIKDNLQELVYEAMEATRSACIATIEENASPYNFYRKDMETDRNFLEELIGSLNHKYKTKDKIRRD